MIPDIEVQLQVIIKSLKDNVLPAIDSENELAIQQAQLSVAALEITLGHLPLVHASIRKDISEHLSMSEKLFELNIPESSKNSLSEIILFAKTAIAEPTYGFVQLQQVARSIRNVIGNVIVGNAENEHAEVIEKVVFQSCSNTINLGRAWNKPKGFEPDPDAVVELSEQLGLET